MSAPQACLRLGRGGDWVLPQYSVLWFDAATVVLCRGQGNLALHLGTPDSCSRACCALPASPAMRHRCPSTGAAFSPTLSTSAFKCLHRPPEPPAVQQHILRLLASPHRLLSPRLITPPRHRHISPHPQRHHPTSASTHPQPLQHRLRASSGRRAAAILVSTHRGHPHRPPCLPQCCKHSPADSAPCPPSLALLASPSCLCSGV